MMVKSALFLSAFLGALAVRGVPLSESNTLEARQGISTLTAAQVASYKPYSYYAAVAYCSPANTLAWSCGAKCNANSGFRPVASGGNGGTVQYWYVGYDSTRKEVIVSYQGTDASKFLPLLTDADFFFDTLPASLFPGISSAIKIHNGFQEAQAASASAVLAAVKTALSRHAATKVTIVGHSLGGAIALVTSVYLPLHLPTSTTFRTVTYGMPRVGNQEFVNYVNSRVSLTRIVNQDDIIPIVPGRFLGYAHAAGEVHIVNSNAWINCPGQDNTNAQCTIGYVPNIFAGDLGDHGGPFDGVSMSCT